MTQQTLRLAVWLTIGALACGGSQAGTVDSGAAPRPAPATEAPVQAAGSDSVRGIVAETGSVPVTSIVVRPARGRGVTILGALRPEIANAVGAEVWVAGRRTAEGLVAERYAVRTVDGEAAVDGTLEAEGASLVLVTGGQRRRIAQPPAGLRGMIGARIWIVGNPESGITSYGVLRPSGGGTR